MMRFLDEEVRAPCEKAKKETKRREAPKLVLERRPSIESKSTKEPMVIPSVVEKEREKSQNVKKAAE